MSFQRFNLQIFLLYVTATNTSDRPWLLRYLVIYLSLCSPFAFSQFSIAHFGTLWKT